ncbi:winged helix-turn-helix transcriptional regulator [Chitinophaga solisilvae]|uniref:Helix-turn-helix transcriptional regulator n=1 Tax=Chitinophaga solisilvae TaxID=1233460 RepID=A0A3S1BN21_9BACT|nr:helix-turn-helix domain-containing protein [Chitinophaga solisilvae]NSL90731.1 helix-turn-helix transcriptional regulator [Chitinophaga solisilvae]
MTKVTSNALNRAFLHSSCRINAALEMIAGRWKPLILIHISENQNRFSLLKQAMPGISDQALGKQLKELEADRLVTKEIIPAIPVRVDYSLTEKGAALLPILQALAEWKDL